MVAARGVSRLAGSAHFKLALPYDRPPKPLWGNARNGHWGQRSTWSRIIRSDVMFLARQAKIPQSTHLDVLLSWAPGDLRKRDSDNLWPMLKACCDGLARGKRTPKAGAAHFVGLDLVPDDTPQYMTKHAPLIMAPNECPVKGMWLDIWAQPVVRP
jgi:crossover junction endodeoxyribonuclease RusA